MRAYRADWGRPTKPLLASAHALLEDELIAAVLTGNPEHRRSERALISLLRGEVRHQLSAGELAAECLRDPIGKPEHIPAERWALLDVNFDRSEASLAGLTIAGVRVWRPSTTISAAPPVPAAPSVEPRETPAQRKARTERKLVTWSEQYMATERAAGRKVSANQFWKDAQQEFRDLTVTRAMAREVLRPYGTLKPGEKARRRKSPD